MDNLDVPGGGYGHNPHKPWGGGRRSYLWYIKLRLTWVRAKARWNTKDLKRGEGVKSIFTGLFCGYLIWSDHGVRPDGSYGVEYLVFTAVIASMAGLVIYKLLSWAGDRWRQ